MPLITSRRNPLVKKLRMLSTKQGREAYSLLLLEGTNLLVEALKTSYLPREIFATRFWLETNFNRLELASLNITVNELTPTVLQGALTTKNPDGVASVFPLNSLPKAKKNVSFALALDRLQDPGNLGTLFRTALAADVELLWLASGADPLSQKVLRASAGAFLHLPYERFGGPEEIAVEAFVHKLDTAARDGHQVVGAFAPNSLQSNLIVPYWELDWTKPTVLVLGNEGKGLHPAVKASCTNFITLPHSSKVESLNVASVAVPLLFERRRAKMSLNI